MTQNKNVTIEDIFSNDGAIARLKDGYKERTPQIEAAKRIDEALLQRCNAVIEGETGMGKSFAYLFPIINNIASTGYQKKAVIATSGISLQEQLITKDAPFAIEVMKNLYPDMGDRFKAALLKGRQNFICLKKVDELGLYKTPKGMVDGKYLNIHDFVNKTKKGDISELDFVPDQNLLSDIACTERGECLGKSCDFYDECHYTNHKKELANSQIIITNYHMLFSDMNTGGKILPNYDIIVFDEAHESSNIFREFCSKKISVHSADSVRKKISEVINISGLYEKALNKEKYKSMFQDFEIAFNQIDRMFNDDDLPKVISSLSELPDTFYQLEEIISERASEISVCLKKNEERVARLKEVYDEGSSENDEYIDEIRVNAALSVAETQIQEMYEFLNSITSLLKNNNEVISVEKVRDNISINNRQVEVGEAMNSQLFEKEALTAIFTSATISVGGSFEYIKDQIGISKSEKQCIEFIGNSPFNLTEQQLWYLPENSVEGNKFGFNKTIAPHISDIINATDGGVLCLFTSVKNMRDTYYQLTRQFGNKYTILVQGDMPRTKLIERFKNDRDSILLGTKSFFTGVDVPGDSLRAVVIDKFPFPQPTDPVQQKLKDRDNSFYKYSIPEMIITLKQAVGRGVRAVDDKCVIAILDGRMCTARYKGRINNSFNYKKTGTRRIEDVEKFCEQFKHIDYIPDEMPF